MSDSNLKNYLFGSLSEDDRSEIELRVMEDEEFAAELFSLEQDLIDAFLSSELSEDDENRFRTNYLVTDDRIKNVEMTALMQRYLRENAKNEPEVSDRSTDKAPSLIEWFNSLGSGLRLAAASLSVILVIGSLWFLLRPQGDNELTALQNRYERLNQDPSSDGPASSLSEITLVSDTLRSAPSNAELVGSELTDDVKFRIALPPHTDISASYDITVFRDTTVVFRQNNILPLSKSAIPELRLILPRRIFSAGNHRAVLTSPNVGEIVYRFVVK